MSGSEYTDKNNGTDNDYHSSHHGQNKVHIGEKVLQSFHKHLIAVYFWLIPRDLTGGGNSTYKKNQKNSI